MGARETHSLNFLERAIAVVSPQTAFSRAEARAALTFFGYDSANPGPLRGRSGGMGKNSSSESAKNQQDTIKIMWEARDVSRNGTLLGGVLRRTVRYCIPKISYQSRTGDRAVDKIYEDYYHDWCKRADLTGRHGMRKLVRQSLYAMMRDGDFGFNKRRVPVGGGKMELRLQSIEADRIGNVLEAGAAGYQENYIRGLTLGEDGEIASVRIYKRNRLGLQYTFEAEIPGTEFIHLADPDESDKYRPPSWLQPALADARDLHEIWGFVKQRCKFASMHSGFITGSGGDKYSKAGFGSWDNQEDKILDKPASLNAAAGLIRDLRGTDSEIKWAPAMNEPAGAFMNLFETGIRKVAVALDLPYGFVWDMSVFGGVTARLETMSADRLFSDKRMLVDDKVLTPTKNEVLELGIMNRDIPPHPNYRQGKFLFGARLTADVGHETAALVQARDAGFTTTSRIQEEWYDEDFDEVTETQCSEVLHKQETAGMTGVPIELQDQSKPGATALLAAINTPPEPPPPPLPGMVGEQGDKGVQPLLDVLKSVGEGTMDRESAINTVMQLYGLNYRDADNMVPEPKKLPKQEAGGGQGQRIGGLVRRKLATGGDE